jgi:asparagine synthase (glutamine-hydrolysing)
VIRQSRASHQFRNDSGALRTAIVMTTETAFLLLEFDRDGPTKTTGQTSFVRSRGSGSRGGSRPFDQLGTVGRSSWTWDGSQLLARTSDTGFVPLFYFKDDNRFAISPSLLLLRERFASGAVDWPALAILLAMGHFIEGDTPFEEVRTLPIRSTLSWRRGSLTVEQRPFEIPHLDISYEESKSRYLAEVRRAIARDLPSGDVAQGLSGGRDSRHILLELLHQGVTPASLVTTSHYLPLSDADTTVAKRLAERLGLPITAISPDANRVKSEIEKNLLTEFQTLNHSWGLRLGAEFGTEATLYDGMNGGVLFGRSAPVRGLRKRYGDIAPSIDDTVQSVLETVFNEPILKLSRIFTESPIAEHYLELARQRIGFAIRRYANAPSPAQAFFYFNHTSRESAIFTLGLMQANCVLCPLDDPEVVRFGLGLPWHISSNALLQTDAIRSGYPDYSNIPFAEQLTDIRSVQHWSPDDECQSAHNIADELEELQISALRRDSAARFVAGEAPLRDLQRIVYLHQLLSWNDAVGQ